MNTNDLLSRAADLIIRARHVTVLTGAGISTPSGIPDFRSFKSGLWNKTNPFLVASLQAFRIRPSSFFDWIRPLARTLLDAVPNPAHLALAQLEKMGRLGSIVTQNIDNLHQKAGSQNVIEIHGHIRQATCVRCYQSVSTDSILPLFIEDNGIPHCERCGGVLKPNVILFGEQLPVAEVRAAQHAARTCDLMLVAGTSLSVAPAADLPLIARQNGADVIVIDKQPTPIDKHATLVIRQDLVLALPRIVALICKQSR
ncbi:MAG: NAD-dependent deacylase [Anaerolineae bacterium]|nr:NAD-dependent deacylase [Anaerolineae bacterium]